MDEAASSAEAATAASDPRVIVFVLTEPYRLPANARLHWSVWRRYRQAIAWQVKLATLGNLPVRLPIPRALVEIERRSIRPVDADNLYAGAKHLVDALLVPGAPYVTTRGGKARLTSLHPYGLGFLVDDNPGAIRLEVAGVRVKSRDQQGTSVRITEIIGGVNELVSDASRVARASGVI